MPSTNRGTFPARLLLAGDLATERHKRLMALVDEMADPGDVGTMGDGGALKKQDHLALLAHDPNYQQSLVARYAWASEPERQQLRRDLLKLVEQYPQGAQTLPVGGQVPPELVTD